MKKKKTKLIIAMIIFAIILALTGMALADYENNNGNHDNNGDNNGNNDNNNGNGPGKDFFIIDNSTFDKDGLVHDQTVNVPFNLYIYVTNHGKAQEFPPDDPVNVSIVLIEEDNHDNPISLGNIVIPAQGHGVLNNVVYAKTGKVHIEVTGVFKDETTTDVSKTFIVNAANKPYSFYLEGYQNYNSQTGQFSQPLNAPDAGSATKWIAGQPFYIKITARNADGSVYTPTYYNTSGKTNVTGSITAVDGSGTPYGSQTFSINGALTDVPNSLGIGMAQAQFNDVGIIYLQFENNLQVASSSDFVGRFYPDHFTLISTPVLQLRVDQGPSTSSSAWGYIGETMQVDLTLEARNISNNLTPGYTENFAKFIAGSSGWNPMFKVGSADYTSRLNFLNSSGSFSNGHAILTSTMTLTQSNSLQSQEIISNLTLSVNPTDTDGVHLNTGSVQALVQSVSPPYTLYGGRIHVSGGYYTQATVNVPVVVERWDGSKFVVNTLDSQTSVISGGFTEVGGTPNVLSITGAFQSSSGTGSLTVSNNGGNNITRTLALQNGAYPSYLDFLSGTLAWGQIVQPGGPPPGSGGIIWEREELLP